MKPQRLPHGHNGQLAGLGFGSAMRSVFLSSEATAGVPIA
jgi:hypothetical protein